jgi:hypothetical protein
MDCFGKKISWSGAPSLVVGYRQSGHPELVCKDVADAELVQENIVKEINRK